MTMAILLSAALAAGAVSATAWQRLRAWHAARKLEWDPY